MMNGRVPTDARRRVPRDNRSACAVLGATEDALVGSDARPVLTKVNADLPATVQQVHDSGPGTPQGDGECSPLDGRAVSMNLNAVPLVDPKGGKLGVVLVLDDITSEKPANGRLSRHMWTDGVEDVLAGE